MKQRHIDRPVYTQVEFSSAAQMRTAVSGEIGPTAGKMKVFDGDRLVCDLEADGVYILNLELDRLQR